MEFWTLLRAEGARKKSHFYTHNSKHFLLPGSKISIIDEYTKFNYDNASIFGTEGARFFFTSYSANNNQQFYWDIDRKQRLQFSRWRREKIFDTVKAQAC